MYLLFCLIYSRQQVNALFLRGYFYYTNHSYCYFTADSTNAARYIGVNSRLSWHAAQAYCREFHTDLALITSTTENDAMQKIAYGLGKSWIGAYRDTWKWSDGTNTSNLLWLSGQPDNLDGDENCVVLDNGMFTDIKCNELHYFICHISESFFFFLQIRMHFVLSSICSN